jgi:hypothetical protein
MAEYRVHFVMPKAHANRHFRSGIGKGYEIWNGDRRVHTEVYQ